MMPVYDQPMRKLLGVLSPTISWLNEKGSVDVSSVPDSHLEAIKQLERIGVVHKRNNRSYELQRIRLKKLLGNLGIETLVAEEAEQMVSAAPAATAE
jgi:predicted transcriptional regulator